MSDTTNADRAHFAHLALETFAREVYNDDGMEADGLETLLGDLLADLRHWADRNGVDFNAAAEAGLYHYEREVEEEKGYVQL